MIMKINILFIIGILLMSFSCSNSGRSDNDDAYIDSETEAYVTQVELNEKDVVPKKDDAKSDLDKLLTIFEKAGNKIPEEYYNLLLSDKQKELLDYDSGAGFYSIMTTQKINDYFLLMIKSGNFDCTAINCQTEFNFLLVNNVSNMVSNYAEGGSYETDPDFVIIHNAFISIKWLINDYEENDAGAMEGTGKSEIFIHYITIIDQKLYELSSLTKKQLRIQRNLIFARYGYKFKSKDLSEYFSKFDWYNPLYNDVKKQLTENDKELITEITWLEDKK